MFTYRVLYSCNKEIGNKRKEENEMSKKKKAKKKLSTKDVITLLIQAVFALAALIQAIKS